MFQNRRGSSGSLLLAGLAAFAYYKYSKMSADEKNNLLNTIKDKGKKLLDQYAPEIGNKLTGKSSSGVNGSNYNFEDSNAYSS